MESELRKSKDELEDIVKDRTRELELALQVKQRFLAIMSHEIRTPLSGMIGCLTLLSSTLLNCEQDELVRMGKVCGEQLLVVINDILDLSKMEENKMSIETATFNFRHALEESLEVVSFNAATKELELLSYIDQSVPELVIGDACRIRQIVVNLLSNAIKFSSCGEITLRASSVDLEGGNQCRIHCSVQDHGIGIAADRQHLLFQPFNQADSSTSRKFGGTGLGLFIAKRFTEMMQGNMWLESNEGEGSTFYFDIVVPKISSSPDTTLVECLGKHVFVAVGNVALEASLKHLLQQFGLRCTVGDIREVALQLDSFMDVDLVLLDSAAGGETIDIVHSKRPLAVIGHMQTPFSAKVYTLKKPITSWKLQRLLLEFFSRGTDLDVHHEERKLSYEMPKETNILIVEDNQVNQKVLKKTLSCIGFQNVDVAAHGGLALEAIRKKQYWVVFMDIMMPIMNGLEANEQIQLTIPQEKRPVIIALTANAFQEEKNNYLNAGMDFVLTKPISKEELVHVLTQVHLRQKSK